MIDLYATDRFRDKASRFRDPVRIRSRIIHILDRAAKDKNWTRDFERIHTHISHVYREKVSKGGRLLFSFDGELVLLDIDDHDIYDDWSKKLNKRSAKKMLESATRLQLDDWRIFPTSKKLSALSVASSLVSTNASINVYDESEWDERWLLYLDEHQMDVLLAIEGKLEQGLPGETHWIWGGAGTGKTVVALHLLRRLRARGVVASFETLEGARRHIEQGFKEIVEIPSKAQAGGVHILDDPLNHDTTLESIRKAKSLGAERVIVFTDPLQSAGQAQTAAHYELHTKGAQSSLFILRDCHRQPEFIGTEIRALAAEAYGYSDYGEEEGNLVRLENRLLEILGLDILYTRKGGIFEVIEEPHDLALKALAIRLNDRYDLWTWTVPILLVWSEGLYSMRKASRHMFASMSKKDVRFGDFEDIRGVEFQEVVLLMTKTEFEELMTLKLPIAPYSWHKFTPLYTFLSRAKDAVTVIIDPKK